jgi:hypothetical protein
VFKGKSVYVDLYMAEEGLRGKQCQSLLKVDRGKCLASGHVFKPLQQKAVVITVWFLVTLLAPIENDAVPGTKDCKSYRIRKQNYEILTTL